MAKGGNYAYHGEHLVMYIIIKSLVQLKQYNIVYQLYPNKKIKKKHFIHN